MNYFSRRVRPCTSSASSGRLVVAFVALIFVAMMSCSPTSVTMAATPSANIRPPNIILVLADDLGWAELGCYGNRFNETPHLDRMAARGVRFTNAYAAAPVCSPFRASFMVGQWPARIGITDYLRPTSRKHLSTDLTTIAEALQSSGYTTGIIGKWHLTGYQTAGVPKELEVRPDQHGFDEMIISENASIGGVSYFHPYHFNRLVKRRLFPAKEHPNAAKNTPGFDTREFLVDRMNLEAVDFIERHQDKPFFLYKSHYSVHTSLNAPQQRVVKYQAKAGAAEGHRGKPNNVHLAGQLEAIDEGVGMIFDKLKELKLTDNTIVIFVSDNGGESNVTSNAPLRAGKSTLYEGGIRVPMIVNWPGHIQKNVVSAVPVCSVDLYPTLLAVARSKKTDRDASEPAAGQPLDGVSLLPLLTGAKVTLPRDTLFWHYPLEKPHFLGGRSGGAVRQGDWKLIEFFDDGTAELYNLAVDESEKNNLAAAQPQRVEAMLRQLAAWRKSVGAIIPAGQQAR